MLHIKDDNNDELFRRAAENYPLKTDSADWETMRAKLDAAVDEPQAEPVEKRKKYRFLWLLLLLIPMGVIENKYKIIGNPFKEGNNDNKTIAAKEPTATAATGRKINGSQKDSSGNTITTDVALNGNISDNGLPDNANYKTSASTTAGNDQSTKKTTNIALRNNVIAGTANEDNFHSTTKHKSKTNQRSKIKITNALATGDDELYQQKTIVKSDKRKQQINMKAGEIGADDEGEKVEKVDGVNKVDGGDKVEEVEKAKKNDKVDKENEPVAVKKPVTEIAKTETKAAKKEDKKKKKSNKHFYVGLMAGPDFSMVKLQSVKKTGINYGFLAGYKINKRFSVETGIYKDKKFYGTAGQYFNTKNIYLPPNATIEYVDGECNMWEVPVNFTYNFRQRSKSAWFVSLGASSYFMTSEAYTYDVLHNNYRYPYSREYKNKSTSLFAVVNIGAGFTYKLGKIADLRIEPYFKLPVNKIGSGNLPIQSAGIMLGLTKIIF